MLEAVPAEGNALMIAHLDDDPVATLAASVVVVLASPFVRSVMSGQD